jgi:hypothetical protein
MGELKKWRDQNWVRINSSGEIAGECGTSKDKKNPDRCLPASKARSLSKSPKAKEEPPLQRKSVKAQKAKPSSKTQKPRKSKTPDLAAKSRTKKPKGKARAPKTGK